MTRTAAYNKRIYASGLTVIKN